MKAKFINLFALWICCALTAPLSYAQGITAPRTASPAASVSQTIGISKISIDYSRPSVKGRVVWGELVPFGWNVQTFGNLKESPWRSGANENTVIHFSHPAKVQGKEVPAGKYGLFFVINKDNTGEVILSKDTRSWGSFWYEKENDQLRAPIQVRDGAHVETLTFDFINPDKTGTELVLSWEKKQFPVKIEFAVDELVMANAIEELKGPVGFGWQGYSSAANYAMQNKINQEQAMKWIDQAIATHRSFNTLRIKAELQKQKGNTAEAESLMKDAMTVATEPEINAYGYQLIAQGDNDKAIQILTVNTEKYPRSANAWDSLGEACVLKGDSKNAVKHFKKALSLNPPANVRANSEKYLKQLGAM
jgi:predicted negative regulator of RcsB-dependent stress response